MECLSKLEARNLNCGSDGDDIGDKSRTTRLVDRLLCLKNKRDCLLQELKNLENKEEENSDSEQSDTEEVSSARLEIKGLEHTQNACRLTGVSVYSRVGNSVILNFDTGYQGEYFSSYYVELTKKRHGALSVSHHSLPSFIPVKQLAKDLLDTDLKTFVDKISDVLYAYVNRREEMKLVTKLFSEQMIVTSTQAVDCIEITVEKTNAQPSLNISLQYKDLLDVLPSEIKVKISKGLQRRFHDAATVISSRLKHLPLSKALEAMQEYFNRSA